MNESWRRILAIFIVWGAIAMCALAALLNPAPQRHEASPQSIGAQIISLLLRGGS